MASDEALAGSPAAAGSVTNGFPSASAAGQRELGHTTLASGPGAPYAARAAVSGWLAPHVAAGALEDARLLVTELVSNSVRHAAVGADAPIHVSAAQDDGMVRVEVADLGRDASVAPRSLQPDMPGGFGLNLVDALAVRWGVTHQPGTHVWFELSVRRRT